MGPLVPVRDHMRRGDKTLIAVGRGPRWWRADIELILVRRVAVGVRTVSHVLV